MHGGKKIGRLDGKVALITGSGSGIGRATAILFAREGAKVVVADYIAEGGEETVTMIKAAGGEAIFVKADVAKATDVEKMVKVAVDIYGQLDILYNNAGIAEIQNVPTAEVKEENWDRVIDIDLKGVFLGMKYGIPEMLKRGGGVIINTASMAGLVGFSYLPAYSAAKAGAVELTKTAAMEYARQNIRVNCICPGGIVTPMLEQREDFGNFIRRRTPVHRLGKPEEVAPAALFLASDESSYVTGTALAVDGGFVAR